ncbi:MAG TPA: S41 family peptidase [Firmicutes bacterium]|nr:S41 family peptidase [Bacillota bacterium]
MNRRRLVVVVAITALISSLATYSALTYVRWKLAPADVKGIEKLRRVISEVSSRYVTDVDPSVLYEGALYGVVRALGDPYSDYYNTEQWKELLTSTTGSYTGVGLYIGVEDKYITVIAPIKGSPADRAGLRPGDKILKVDDRDVTGMPSDVVANLIKGKAGTRVNLLIGRGGTQPFSVVLLRENINVPSAEGKMLENDIGYLQLIHFNENAYSETKRELDMLIKGGAKGIILDLRGNPGGLLDQSVRIAELFVPRGVVVSVVDKAGGKQVYESKSEGLKLPLVTLVDKGSASASEILAGAIKDRGVGPLVGTRTFGKGSVQTLVDLPDGSGLKLTTAKYYTPKGVSINGTGIEPDVLVEVPAEQKPGEDVQLEEAKKIILKLIAEAGERGR